MKIGLLQSAQNAILNDNSYELVYSSLLTSAQTSITISGLNGNLDEEYRLICFIVNVSGSQSYYYMRPNNDSGSNYGFAQIRAVDTVMTATRGTTNTSIELAYSDANNYMSFCDLTFLAKSGKIRAAINRKASLSSTVISHAMVDSFVWNNTVDNITSMTLLASTSNAFSTGTHIFLFRKNQKRG
jgi:hypothetical protein